MAAYLPEGSVLPEPKKEAPKPEGGEAGGEKKMSKSALKKLAKTKVSLFRQ